MYFGKQSLQEKETYDKILSFSRSIESLKTDDEKVEFILFELQKVKNAGMAYGMKKTLDNIVNFDGLVTMLEEL